MDGEDRSSSTEAPAVTSAEPIPRASAKPPSQAMALAKIAIVMTLLGGAVAALLVSNQDVFVYSHLVDEVMAQPEEFADRTLRVEGDLVDGTVQFREDPCEYRFTIARNDQRMQVEFPECIVPDTFREGMGISVVVEGRLAEDGSFHASDVIPRCPSRYEMDEARGRGEAMPHGIPAARTTELPHVEATRPPS